MHMEAPWERRVEAIVRPTPVPPPVTIAREVERRSGGKGEEEDIGAGQGEVVGQNLVEVFGSEGLL